MSINPIIKEKNINSVNWWEVTDTEDLGIAIVYVVICRYTGEVKRQVVKK